jgi:tetratricopeptide (TPR) repeat protein
MSNTRRAVVLLTLAALSGIVTPAETRGRLVERLHTGLAEADRELSAGRLDRAAVLFERASDDATRLGPANLPLARALDGLADVHRLEGRPARAVDLYLRSIEIWETVLGPGQPRLATSLHNLGVAYLALDRPDEAAAQWRRALVIWETTLGPDSPQAQNTRSLYRRFRPEPG